MKKMYVNGKKEEIPPFPHHKNYVYRSNQFFRPKSLLTHITIGRFITIKEVVRGYKYKCSIPRTILIDPTSSCNLKCKGCWAADYAKGDNLSFEKLDDILTQTERLGILDVQVSGGEPLMRKDDLLRLCRKHRKTSFGVFTNATLIDDAFAEELEKIGNLNMYVSIEGTKEETDFRRGEGVYDKVVAAMQILHKRNIGFAFSTCYHAKNYKTIASDEFLDDMRARGAWFGWLFNYVPVGKDADLSLVCTPEQRAYVKDKVDEYCARNKYTVIDFWNNGHTTCGCVAAGTGFLHINAKGDVEPCAFCHYSDCNINDMSLVEALQSPFLTRFRSAQPFSDNPLRACPLIDIPDVIVERINDGGAHSTHYSAPESAEALADKTRPNAEKWQPVADELLKSLEKRKISNYKSTVRFIKFRRNVTDGRRIR